MIVFALPAALRMSKLQGTKGSMEMRFLSEAGGSYILDLSHFYLLLLFCLFQRLF